MNVNLTDSLGPNFAGKLKSSRNLTIEVVLLIVFSILFYWFIVLPKQAAVNVQKTDLQTLEDQESKMAAALSDLNNLVASLPAHTAEITELDEAIPLASETNRVQALIQNLADSLNLSVANVTLARKTTGPVAGDKALLNDPYGATRTLQTLSGSANVTGTFDQLQAFLRKLENSGKLIDVSGLSIDSGTNGNLNLKVTINTYYLAPY